MFVSDLSPLGSQKEIKQNLHKFLNLILFSMLVVTRQGSTCLLSQHLGDRGREISVTPM